MASPEVAKIAHANSKSADNSFVTSWSAVHSQDGEEETEASSEDDVINADRYRAELKSRDSIDLTAGNHGNSSWASTGSRSVYHSIQQLSTPSFGNAHRKSNRDELFHINHCAPIILDSVFNDVKTRSTNAFRDTRYSIVNYSLNGKLNRNNYNVCRPQSDVETWTADGQLAAPLQSTNSVDDQDEIKAKRARMENIVSSLRSWSPSSHLMTSPDIRLTSDVDTPVPVASVSETERRSKRKRYVPQQHDGCQETDVDHVEGEGGDDQETVRSGDKRAASFKELMTIEKEIMRMKENCLKSFETGLHLERRSTDTDITADFNVGDELLRHIRSELDLETRSRRVLMLSDDENTSSSSTVDHRLIALLKSEIDHGVTQLIDNIVHCFVDKYLAAHRRHAHGSPTLTPSSPGCPVTRSNINSNNSQSTMTSSLNERHRELHPVFPMLPPLTPLSVSGLLPTLPFPVNAADGMRVRRSLIYDSAGIGHALPPISKQPLVTSRSGHDLGPNRSTVACPAALNLPYCKDTKSRGHADLFPTYSNCLATGHAMPATVAKKKRTKVTDTRLSPRVHVHSGHTSFRRHHTHAYQQHRNRHLLRQPTMTSQYNDVVCNTNDSLYHATPSRYHSNKHDSSSLPYDVMNHQHSRVSSLVGSSRSFQIESSTSRLARPSAQNHREPSFRTMTSPSAESDCEFPVYEDGVDESHLTTTLTPMHLRKAKLMFFYVRYPSSAILKAYFPDVQFNKNNTAQLVKWFSNFREFFYIQMEKYARQALAEGVKNSMDLVVELDDELYRVLVLHYNRNNQIEVPDSFRYVVQAALREFYISISAEKDLEQSWKKSIYKVIARLDDNIPDYFKSPNWIQQLIDS